MKSESVANVDIKNTHDISIIPDKTINENKLKMLHVEEDESNLLCTF